MIPGYTVTIGDRPAANLFPTSTAVGFMVAYTERGSVTAPTLIISPADAVAKLGERITGEPIGYDSIEAFFREGGGELYVQRINAKAEAATAKKEGVDSESKKDILFEAKSPGTWGNNLKVAITKTSTLFAFVVKYNGATVETSESFSTVLEAVTWAEQHSAYVVVKAEVESTAIPKTQELTLSGGTYAYTEGTDANVETALGLFNKDLGPGQVFAPGRTSEAVHKALAAHALNNNRRAILDDPDESSASVIAGHATALRTLTGNAQRFATMVAPWAYIPGLSAGTTRKIPYSAIFAGQISRSEAEGNNPNIPAAGAKRGACNYALSLSQTFSSTGIEELNNAGVILSKSVRGVPTTFGNRTLTNPTTDANWKSFSASRLIMGIAAKAEAVIENYEFAQIDGHGYVFKDLQGDLQGAALMPFYLQNALYGNTPGEAFAVNTGSDVNTPTTIANEEIKAQIVARVSPTGEVLTVEIVKVPTSEGII